jgi:hypothetical protein
MYPLHLQLGIATLKKQFPGNERIKNVFCNKKGAMIIIVMAPLVNETVFQYY